MSKCVQEDTRVDLQIRVESTGDVSEADALSSNPEDPRARDCVANEIRRAKFSRPSGGATTLKFSIAVRPAGSDAFKVGH